MSQFEYVIVLLSFVYALALTHVFSRVGAMMLARDRVRFSGLLAVAILNAVVQVFTDWLTSWDYRNLPEWNLLTIMVCFLVATAVFFVCAAVVPEVEGGEPIDMEAFYWKNYRLYYGLWILLIISYVAASLPLVGSDPHLALAQASANLPFFAPVLLAFFVKAKWAQWVGGLGLLVFSVFWPIIFSGAL